MTDPNRPDAPGDTLGGLIAQFGNLVGQWEQRAYGRLAMNERTEAVVSDELMQLAAEIMCLTNTPRYWDNRVKVAQALAVHDALVAARARLAALRKCIEVARNIVFRCHAEDDRDFHSGCVQTRDSIVDAINKLESAARESGGQR